MSTVFDLVTVACFGALVLAFFFLTDREPKTLLSFLLPAAAFAVANQAGNAGFWLIASVLILAGAGYAAILVRGRLS